MIRGRHCERMATTVLSKISRAGILIPMWLGLSACDAWPTTVVDRTNTPIQFRWHHEDHAEWSVWITVPAGESVLLARAHYVEDFESMEVMEADKTYSVTPTQMAEFRSICARTWVDRITTLGDCEIAYGGGGKFTVRRVR